MSIGMHWSDEELDLLGLEMPYPADASNCAFPHHAPCHAHALSIAMQVLPEAQP